MPSTHINKFPPEILSKIFLIHIQTVTPKDIHRPRSDLSLVCRYWRQTVESHARLWSTIYIHRPDPIFPPAFAVGLFLKRSVGAPLEIHLGANCWSPQPDLEDTDDSQMDAGDVYTKTVFSLLASQAFRWQRIAIKLDTTLADGIQRIAFSKAEQLEYVGVVAGRSVTWDDIGRVTTALADAPNLRWFEWSSGSGSITPRFETIMPYFLTTLPLERLTHLILNCLMSVSEFLQLMQKCTSAVEMSIKIITYYIRSESSENLLPLAASPNLRTLILEFEVADYTIFEYFDFPNLEIISITTAGSLTRVDDANDNDITPLSYYLSSSRHCVQALLVHDHLLLLEGLATFLSDPAVSKIPIVQVCAIREMPDDIREEILKAVETGLPGIQRAEFRISPVDRERWWGWTVMGWTDASTCEKFEDRLAVDHADTLACTFHPQTI